MFSVHCSYALRKIPFFFELGTRHYLQDTIHLFGNPEIENECPTGSPVGGNDDDYVLTRSTSPAVLLSDTRDNMQPPVPKGVRKNEEEDPRISMAFQILKDTHSRVNLANRDRFTTYGEHVGNKLRRYSDKVAALVEHKINNILFNLDIAYYTREIPNVTTPIVFTSGSTSSRYSVPSTISSPNSTCNILPTSYAFFPPEDTNIQPTEPLPPMNNYTFEAL